jgi:hypothetical protein
MTGITARAKFVQFTVWLLSCASLEDFQLLLLLPLLLLPLLLLLLLLPLLLHCYWQFRHPPVQ